jgi:Tol biopolymer transport system component
MKKTVLLFSILVTFGSSLAQLSREELYMDARELMSFNHPAYYKRALGILKSLNERTKGRNDEYKYHLAICYLNTNIDKKKAAELLSTIEKGEKEFGASFHYYSGLSSHYAYRFNKALESFELFLGKAKKKDGRRSEVLRRIEMCSVAKDMIQNPLHGVKIENMGGTINSPGPEYTPVISADESVIIFTSRREGSVGGKMDLDGTPSNRKGDYYEDVFISYKEEEGWSKPKNIGPVINSHGHDAAIGLSPDGQTLYLYRSDSVKWGNIFACRLNGEIWESPMKLKAPINSKNWEGSCSINADNNLLFFVSNRPEGFGGKDIYMIRKLPNGEWAAPKNLGPTINTPEDEDAPFIHVDGQTLYFSSKGHKSMGGYDIFKTTYNEGGWSTPVNIGYPINTAEDDRFFVLSPDGKRGYYAVTKGDGYGDQDLYVVHMPKSDLSAPEAVTLLKGVLKTSDGAVAENALITVTDQSTGDLVGVFKPNKATGKYLIVIPQGKNYVLRVDAVGYSSFSENIASELTGDYSELNKNISLQPSK